MINNNAIFMCKQGCQKTLNPGKTWNMTTGKKKHLEFLTKVTKIPGKTLNFKLILHIK